MKLLQTIIIPYSGNNGFNFFSASFIWNLCFPKFILPPKFLKTNSHLANWKGQRFSNHLLKNVLNWSCFYLIASNINSGLRINPFANFFESPSFTSQTVIHYTAFWKKGFLFLFFTKSLRIQIVTQHFGILFPSFFHLASNKLNVQRQLQIKLCFAFHNIHTSFWTNLGFPLLNIC